MSITASVSRPYAKALFLHCLEQSDVCAAFELCHQQFDCICDVLGAFDSGSKKLFNHCIFSRKLVDFVSDSLRADHCFSPQMHNFLSLLAHHKRWSLLPEIRVVFTSLHDDKRGQKTLFVESAFDLNDAQKDVILSFFEKRINCKCVIEKTVNSSLLAGARVHYDDYVVDFSLSSKLNRLDSFIV